MANASPVPGIERALKKHELPLSYLLLTLWNSPGEGNGNPLEYPGLENPGDRGAWRNTAHAVTKNGT